MMISMAFQWISMAFQWLLIYGFFFKDVKKAGKYDDRATYTIAGEPILDTPMCHHVFSSHFPTRFCFDIFHCQNNSYGTGQSDSMW